MDKKAIISSLQLSQEDLLKAGCFDTNQIVKIIEAALVSFKKGEIIFPDKTVQIFDKKTQSRINCLPSTLLREKVCGVKWVSVFPQNPALYNKQNLSAVILLSNIRDGFPLTIMDGTFISNIRTAGIGSVAAKYLAKKDSKVIGFIGSGEQAKMHLITMLSVRPSLKECRVASLNPKNEEKFIREMQVIFPGVLFQGTKSDLGKAVIGADIVITATSAQLPLLKKKWLKEGVFYCHVGGYEDEFSVALACNKIVCDDWQIVKHRTQTLSLMYKKGILKDQDVYANLVEIVSGKKQGRQNPMEKIYFNSVGLSYLDIAIANWMYQKCLKASLGKEIIFQKEMIFSRPDIRRFIKS